MKPELVFYRYTRDIFGDVLGDLLELKEFTDSDVPVDLRGDSDEIWIPLETWIKKMADREPLGSVPQWYQTVITSGVKWETKVLWDHTKKIGELYINNNVDSVYARANVILLENGTIVFITPVRAYGRTTGHTELNSQRDIMVNTLISLIPELSESNISWSWRKPC